MEFLFYIIDYFNSIAHGGVGIAPYTENLVSTSFRELIFIKSKRLLATRQLQIHIY